MYPRLVSNLSYGYSPDLCSVSLYSALARNDESFRSPFISLADYDESFRSLSRWDQLGFNLPSFHGAPHSEQTSPSRSSRP